MTLRQLLRWKAIVPLVLLAVLLGVLWMIFLDSAAARAVERAGTYLVGARVDVASADVRLAEGSVTLRGLAVTNPNAPMSNLFEASEIVADLRVGPLLERRVAVETLAVRGVRFNTPREESGALVNPPPGSGRIVRELSAWADQMVFPPFSLEGLSQVVDLDAIRPEDLRTLAQAEQTIALADSADQRWQGALGGLDPRPQIDTARVLVERLRSANIIRLGLTGVTNLVTSARSTASAIGSLRGRVAALDSTARGDLAGIAQAAAGLTEARAADLAAARGMLRLPSLRAPEISPALFGDAAVAWVRPILYWVRVAEEHLPPGLQPQRFAGPGRARRSGTTVRYPGAAGPAFLVEYAEADLELGGTGAAAGRYVARLTGLSSAPALTGRPLEIRAVRDAAERGPRRLDLGASLHHGTRPVADTVRVRLDGFTLPELAVPALDARLIGVDGRIRLDLVRTGDAIDGRLEWTSDAVEWLRGDSGSVASGFAGRFEDIVWRTLGGLNNVDVSVRVSGTVAAPRLDIRSNVGGVLAQSLRQELGRELQEAEAQIRARVDALVEPEIARARARVQALETEARTRIQQPLAELREVEQQIRDELERLARRIPGLPSDPRGSERRP
jgi:uncharacterized protein (TIGR03545 family)